MSDLYTKQILRWTMKIPGETRLENPDVTVVRKSRICGSSIELDICFQKDRRIREFGWQVQACALGQASAAITGRNLIGLDQLELEAVTKAFEAQTTGGEKIDWNSIFEGKWAGLADLAIVHGHPGRYGSVMLPFETVADAFRRSAAD